MTNNPWYFDDEILFPIILLAVGPPPKTGMRLVSHEGVAKWVRRWGASASVYAKAVDEYIDPLVREALLLKHKFNYVMMKKAWRRNQYLIWLLAKRAEVNTQ